jgi:putative acetyltransferase
MEGRAEMIDAEKDGRPEGESQEMVLQEGISPVHPEDIPRIVEVWEASVRETHHFLTEADIELFKPLVEQELPSVAELACVRDGEGQVVGFVGVEKGKVEMLFVHPEWRGQGIGATY